MPAVTEEPPLLTQKSALFLNLDLDSFQKVLIQSSDRSDCNDTSFNTGFYTKLSRRKVSKFKILVWFGEVAPQLLQALVRQC